MCCLCISFKKKKSSFTNVFFGLHAFWIDLDCTSLPKFTPSLWVNLQPQCETVNTHWTKLTLANARVNDSTPPGNAIWWTLLTQTIARPDEITTVTRNTTPLWTDLSSLKFTATSHEAFPIAKDEQKHLRKQNSCKTHYSPALYIRRNTTS